MGGSPIFTLTKIFIKMKIKFRHIMLVMALAVAGCAAYFSVWGLSQLFAGASFAVILMASVLEMGKLVVTTALHTYWDKFAKPLRAYLAVSVVILMLITSAGIYGFLSNAYQKTANKLEIHEGEVGVLDAKKAVFQKSIDDNQKIIDSKTKRLDQLSGLRTTQENRIDGSKSNRDKSSVRGDIASANSEIQKLSAEIDGLNSKNAVLSDSIGKYNVMVLQKKSTSDVAGEVGPLKYISELTGVPMAKVVNYMILLLIFVFDPLAIALVLATNKAFDLAGESTPLEPKKDSTKEVLEEILEELKHEHELEDEGVNKGVNENNEGVNEEPEIEEPALEEPEVDFVAEDEGVNDDAVNDAVNDAVTIETPIEHKPVIPTGKIELADLAEGTRGYSVNVPQPRTNNGIERIGSNKIVKGNNNNKVFFRRD